MICPLLLEGGLGWVLLEASNSIMSLVNGKLKTDRELWTVDFKTIDHKRWTVDHKNGGLWTMNYQLWTINYKLYISANK